MPARLLRSVHEDPFDDLAEAALSLAPDELEAFASALDDDDLVLLEQTVGSRLATTWRGTPDAMAEHLTRHKPEPYQRWPFARLLGRKFAEAVEGISTRQIWNMPAQYGKSWLASQWGPAWALDRYPDRRFILTSYADDLADRNALAVRDILMEHAGLLRCTLRRDQRRQDRFSTEQGGGLLAAGIRAAMTGFPAHGVVVDDPFKDWPEAHSEAQRQLVWNQYRSVIRLRLTTEDAFIIVVMTRWHPDDLVGKLMAESENETGERWELVRLPEIAEEHDPKASDPVLRFPDPLGRKPGEILEPGRFGPEAVRQRHISLGSYLTAGMAQQRPAPEEGGEIKRAWWRLEDRVPERADEWITSWDMKLKDKESGDFVVGGVWARTGKDYWLLDLYRGQWGFATTVNAIALAAVRHPQCRTHLLENSGNGPEVMAELQNKREDYEVSDDIASQLGMTETEREAVNALRRRGLNGVLPITPKGDKRARMRAVTPTIEAGDVHLPRHASWLGGFLDETAAFPNGLHDDQVDMTSQALSRLLGGQVRLSIPRRSIPVRGR